MNTAAKCREIVRLIKQVNAVADADATDRIKWEVISVDLVPRLVSYGVSLSRFDVGDSPEYRTKISAVISRLSADKVDYQNIMESLDSIPV